MPDPIADELRRLGGPDLYRRNAFRVSGLLADADARTARQVAQRLRAALEVGADIDLGTATSRDPHEIQAACDLILGDPRRRLVHEMFAPWGDDVSACGCSPELHRHHDDAVEAHSEAIGREQNSKGSDALWNRARQSWSKVVGASTAHLQSRVRELDDRQLDRSAVAAIERELPRTLVQPAVDLAVSGRITRARKLAEQARKFPRAKELHRRLLETAAVPLYEELEERRTQIGRRIGAEPADGIVAEIEQELRPKLERLDALLPPAENHRTALLHDQLAILLNNCAVELMNNGEVGDGRAEQWLYKAEDLAVDQRELDLIKENRDALVESQGAMREFREQVEYLYRLQGKNAALRLLKQAHRQTTSATVRAEIDLMIAEIHAGAFGTSDYSRPTTRPTTRPAVRPTAARPVRRRRRVVTWLVVLALIAFGVWHWWPDKAEVLNDRIADNAPVGTCLGDQDDHWIEKPAKLSMGDCNDLHWGEIIAYVPLTKVPGAYPGDVRAQQLGNFLCGEAMLQQHLPPDYYAVNAVHAPAERWNTGKNSSNYENYVACVLHARDSAGLPSGGLARPDEPKTPVAVPMDLTASDLGDNAPVGTCVQGILDDVPIEKVPVVRCNASHWAQIFGYAKVYDAEQDFPGDSEVNAASRQACRGLIPSLPGYATTVGPPAYPGWQDPEQPKYAYCLVHRADNKPFKGALK